MYRQSAAGRIIRELSATVTTSSVNTVINIIIISSSSSRLIRVLWHNTSTQTHQTLFDDSLPVLPFRPSVLTTVPNGFLTQKQKKLQKTIIVVNVPPKKSNRFANSASTRDVESHSGARGNILVGPIWGVIFEFF